MAKGETVGGLYLRLGLSYDELNQDFVKVEQTISENVQRLNRESKLIRLKADIDLTGVTDAAEKLKIQQQALTRQIESQIQKVKLYEASWKSAAQATGETSKQAQNAAISLKQQELALSKLQQQLREVTAQQQELAKSSTRTSGGLLGGYNSIKGNAAGSIGKLTSAFQGVKDAAGSAGGAITKALDIIDAIPSPVGKAVAALASIPLVVKGIENSLLGMAQPAMSSGDALYAMSRGMQMEIADAAQLSTICKVTGIELSEVAVTTRRVATALTKTDEKTTLMKRTLQQYGVELKNSNGELKNTLDISIALAEGLKKAQAEGRGKEFIASVFGRFYSGDYITYLEDLAGNIELAKKIVRNGLADPVLAHEVQGNMNALNTQIEQLSGAFSYAFLPVANKIIPRTMEQFGELTKIIAENKDGIQAFGTAMAEVVGTIGSVAMTATNNVIRLVGALGELVSNKAKKDSVIDKYVNDEKIKSLEDLVAAELQRNYTYTERISIESSPALYQQTLSHYKPMFKALEEAREKLEKELAELNKVLNTPVSVADFSAIGQERRASGFDDKLSSLRETIKIINEASDIMFKLNHTDYENKKLDLARWAQDLLSAENMTAEQREAYEKLYAAKTAQIEKDRADKLAEIRESIAAGDRTALEKRLAEIEREKQAWISAGMEEAEATALAERLKANTIKTVNADAVANLGAIWNTALEKRLAEIEREKQAWIDKGIEEVKATKWAEQAKADARKSAAMSVLKTQLEEYRVFQGGGYEGLMKYRREELFKSGIKPEDLYMTSETLAKFQKAQDTVERNLLPNFATDYDRAEASRLINNELVESQQMLHRAFDKLDAQDFLSGREVRAMVAMPTMDRSALPTEEALEKMYDPVNHTAEEFENLVPQLGEASEGIKDFNGAITQFSAVEQPEPPEIPTAPESPSAEPAVVQLPEIDTSKIAAAFEELALPLEEFGGQIEELTSQLIDTTSALENLASLEKPSSQETAGVESQLVDSATVERFVAQIAETADATENFKTVVAGFEIPPIDTSAINAEFAELVSPMSEVNARFAGMSANLADVTNGLAELSHSLNQFSVPQQNQSASQQAQSAPLNITVNVQIDEAHAWDSRHIQELADKVADKIEPELVSAIGGDSNRY